MIFFLLVLLLQPTPRHSETVRQFERLTGHPGGWPGHVVDHKVPLCAGGPDTIENMQWQTVAAAKQKDRFERELCRAMREEGLTLVKRVSK